MERGKVISNWIGWPRHCHQNLLAVKPTILILLVALDGYSACLNQGVFDWHGGTNGAALSTTANLPSCYVGQSVSLDYYGSGPSTMVFDNSITKPLDGPLNLCTGGSTAGANTFSIKLNTTTSLNHCFNIWPDSPNTNVASAGCWVLCNFPTTSDLNNDFFTIFAADQTFENVLWAGNDGAGHVRISQEGSEVSYTQFINLHTNTWYWITIRYETIHNSPTGRNYIWVYDTSRNVVGKMDSASYSDSPPNRLVVGSSNLVSPMNGYAWWYGSVVYDFNQGRFPLMPGDVTNYYCATTGTNIASGSVSDPWKTIAGSLTNMASGNTLNIRAGTYQEGSATVSGPSGTSAGSPTTLRAYPGETPVYTGTGNTGRWTFGNVSNFNVYDLTISNLNQCLVINNGSHHMVVSNITAGRCGQEIILVQNQVSNVTFQANTIAYSRIFGSLNGEGFYIGTPNSVGLDNTHDITIRSNLVHDVSSEGIEFKEGTHDCLAEYNILYSCSTVDDARTIELDEGINWASNPNHIVRGNILHDTKSPIRAGTGCSIYNNIVYNVTNQVVLVDNLDSDSYPRNIWHNTFDTTPAQQFTFSGGATNIVNNLGPTNSGNMAISSEYFVDYSGHDYRLANGSSPVRAGSALSSSVPTDFNGATRNTSQPSIGAFENGSSTGNTTHNIRDLIIR
jgi:hypothetical protein